MMIETPQHSLITAQRFAEIRKMTEHIVEPLETEDFVVQSMPDVSPAKWHLAHTTWFFERFVLVDHDASYQVFHPQYDYLFNSYYETIGQPFPRSSRGLLARPGIQEVFAYRKYVEEHLLHLIKHADEKKLQIIEPIIEIGLNHEQQHQELILTDIKYNFSINPLRPVYKEQPAGKQPSNATTDSNDKLNWQGFAGGLVEIGHSGHGFAFDNEGPRHKVWLDPFRMASRPVTNGEFIQFIEDGGYHEVQYWLSDGWTVVQQEGWQAPLYWEKREGEWHHYTLAGMKKVDPQEPVTHVSYYEAAAYASWAGQRLPTEAEWEHAFADTDGEANENFLESGYYHPAAKGATHPTTGLSQGFGNVWEWTMSPYAPYPGNKPLEGALGEYNAKFMANQMVLRGGSCVTPKSHIRRTYRNFFQPEKRWQFSGFRLAGDGE